jgi:hypothetical protein
MNGHLHRHHDPAVEICIPCCHSAGNDKEEDMITGAAVFQTLHSLSHLLKSREGERSAEIAKVDYDIKSHEVSFGSIISPHVAALQALPSASEFPRSFDKKLADCRERIGALTQAAAALERDRESMFERLEAEKAASGIDPAVLRKYQSRVAATADVGRAVSSKHKQIEGYNRRVRKVEDYAATLRARRSSKMFGFLFDRRSAGQLASAERAISDWKVFLDDSRADLNRTEESYIEAKQALNMMVAENGAALRDTDAMMKAHGEIISMASRNLEAARNEKTAADEELARLKAAHDDEFVKWFRNRLQSAPSVRGQMLEEVAAAGIASDSEIVRLESALVEIARLEAQRGRLESALAALRSVSESRREAAVALANNGWTKSKELFPGISLPDLSAISAGRSCEDVLDKVGQIAMTCTPSFRTSGADRTEVRRPPAYPFH